MEKLFRLSLLLKMFAIQEGAQKTKSPIKVSGDSRQIFTE